MDHQIPQADFSGRSGRDGLGVGARAVQVDGYRNYPGSCLAGPHPSFCFGTATALGEQGDAEDHRKDFAQNAPGF